jgi:DNA-directed RNA polymerase specialized sigma subunit
MESSKPQRSGRNQHGDKVADDVIRQILYFIEFTNKTQTDIAIAVGCSQALVSQIKHKKRTPNA